MHSMVWSRFLGPLGTLGYLSLLGLLVKQQRQKTPSPGELRSVFFPKMVRQCRAYRLGLRYSSREYVVRSFFLF